MVGLVDFQITKQTGIFISGRINDGSARPAIDRLYAHDLHKRIYMATADLMTHFLQLMRHPSR
jgi:hypothetical protein